MFVCVYFIRKIVCFLVSSPHKYYITLNGLSLNHDKDLTADGANEGPGAPWKADHGVIRKPPPPTTTTTKTTRKN